MTGPAVDSGFPHPPEEAPLAGAPPLPDVAAVAVDEVFPSRGQDGPPQEDKAAKPGRRKRGRPARGRRELLQEVRELRERLSDRGETPAQDEVPAQATPAEPAVVVDLASARKFAFHAVSFIFRAVAMERGEHWLLKEQDREWTDHLGDGLGPLLPAMGGMLPWLLGGMGLVSAIQERVQQDKARGTDAEATSK